MRIVTGDYLDITQASALERLVDWQESASRSDVSEDEDDAVEPRGSIEMRVIEVEKLPRLTRAFHPKSWRFESSHYGIAFVGSSNLSRSALDTGIEWNLRVDRDRDPAFESLW